LLISIYYFPGILYTIPESPCKSFAVYHLDAVICSSPSSNLSKIGLNITCQRPTRIARMTPITARIIAIVYNFFLLWLTTVISPLSRKFISLDLSSGIAGRGLTGSSSKAAEGSSVALWISAPGTSSISVSSPEQGFADSLLSCFSFFFLSFFLLTLFTLD